MTHLFTYNIFFWESSRTRTFWNQKYLRSLQMVWSHQTHNSSNRRFVRCNVCFCRIYLPHYCFFFRWVWRFFIYNLEFRVSHPHFNGFGSDLDSEISGSIPAELRVPKIINRNTLSHWNIFLYVFNCLETKLISGAIFREELNMGIKMEVPVGNCVIFPYWAEMSSPVYVCWDCQPRAKKTSVTVFSSTFKFPSARHCQK